MTAKILRSFVTDLEVRTEGSQRLIVGHAVPYGSTADVGGFSERFVPGAFARSIAERGKSVKLLANHDAKVFPIGRPERLWETDDGLFMEGRVSRTAAGDEALTLVADGVVTGLSVGFRPIRESTTPDGVREVREAALIEISLTAFPAYPDAQIASVRSYLDRLDVLSGAPRPPDLSPSDLSDEGAQRRVRLMEMNR